jgi:hypothetical protein
VCTNRVIPNPFEVVVALLAFATGVFDVELQCCLRKSGFAVVVSGLLVPALSWVSIHESEQQGYC